MTLKAFAIMYTLSVWIGATAIMLALFLVTILTGGELTIDFNSFHNNWPEDALMSPSVAILTPLVVIPGVALALTPWVYVQIRNTILDRSLDGRNKSKPNPASSRG